MAAFRNLLRRKPAYHDVLSDWQAQLENALASGGWDAVREETPEEIVQLFAIDQVYACVHQEGFEALFAGSAKALVEDAVAGFSSIGLPGIAATISRAAARSDEDSPDFSKENDEFYAAAHTEGLLGHPKYVAFADAYALQARQRLGGRST